MEKIYLEQGERLYTEPTRVVCITGEYEPEELVEVGESNNPIYPPTFPLYQYPAYFIKYGNQYDQPEVGISE
jgi:hypothetical protein